MTHTSRLVTAFAAAVATMMIGSRPAVAQAHRTSFIIPTETRHIQTISPLSGPPGTLVSVSTLNLPIESKVHVGVGELNAGFEALTEAEQGELGEISVQVLVPDTHSWTRPIIFIAFNAIFAVIGLSDPFHVTDGEGKVRREGRVTEEADGCLTFRDKDDFLYALTGDVADLHPGDEVRIDGMYLDTGSCMSGPTIGVSAIAR